jgi:hypothetical protein
MRHYLNVGWVTVEFATLEAEIGEVIWLLLRGSYPVGTQYMEYVVGAKTIEDSLKECANRYPNSREALDKIRHEYKRLKGARDKLAHSSVGIVTTSSSFHAAPRLRHAKSGAVEEIPTDEEIQAILDGLQDLSRYVESIRWGKLLVGVADGLRPMWARIKPGWERLTGMGRRS